MNNFNDDLKRVSSLYDLPETTLITLQKTTEFKTLKKKEIFIKEGEYQSQFFFLTSGIARAYITDDNGKEFTRSLFTAPTAIASVRALTTNSKAEVNFDCLTECTLYVGNYHEFINLTKTNLEFSNLYCKMLEKGLLDTLNRIHEFSLTAVEKYKLLQEQIPDIDNLIPQYQIASYLNITNVQLSRIRNKMFK